MFDWFRSSERRGWAISPGASWAVATWYSSGLNTWWFWRSMSVTVARARRNARAAYRPPKPPPTMTTRCCRLPDDVTDNRSIPGH